MGKTVMGAVVSRALRVTKRGSTRKLRNTGLSVYSHPSDDAQGAIIESWTLVPPNSERNTE